MTKMVITKNVITKNVLSNGRQNHSKGSTVHRNINNTMRGTISPLELINNRYQALYEESMCQNTKTNQTNDTVKNDEINAKAHKGILKQDNIKEGKGEKR